MIDYSTIHVLVIDDEPAICMSLTAFLEDYGFKASSAESAEEALDLMKNNVYNICIVDLRLPGMSGEDLIVCARERYPAQRHIIYTGSISYNLSEKLQELGMRPEHVFHKPVRVLSLLVKCIKEQVAQARENED
ncbi:response regulator [Pontiella sulfatireligans]|uniref:Alginate biosynthesis transcriptional regulatory protein AlgB n=1 Tax=Pontiella sulfatireligans TaxID=2750658 RepID=A0A6C2UMQ4_9BACT|nr:response regulator [Pontiella sulfatireligans]VGO21289.1 Alginate biosynthesis transcriptional regulatory protein AlgB [Pontiella sulfatireligans]